MNKLKNLLIIGLVIALAAIIWIVYTVLSKDPPVENYLPLPNVAVPDELRNNNSQQPTLKTYNSSKYGLSFSYPSFLLAEQYEPTAGIFVPYNDVDGVDAGPTQIEADFSYILNVEYCAPSGDCAPSTENMNFGFSAIDEPIESIRAKSKNTTELTRKTFGKNVFYEAQQGAEGEGIFYYFIPLDKETTLMFYRTYLDENILIAYKDTPNFISYAKQGQIMNDILSSLTFTK